MVGRLVRMDKNFESYFICEMGLSCDCTFSVFGLQTGKQFRRVRNGIFFGEYTIWDCIEYRVFGFSISMMVC